MIDMTHLMADIIAEEGLCLRAYVCPAGRNTIGVGHNLDANGLSPATMEFMIQREGVQEPNIAYVLKNGISEATARFILAEDLAVAIHSCEREFVFWGAVDPARQRALVNFVFNIGITGALGFHKFLAAMTVGDYLLAADELLSSNYARQVPARAHRIANLIARGA